VRKCICVCFLIINGSVQAESVSIEDLAWMTGSWTGTLGPLTVEESWSSAYGGSMDTMIRLSNADGITMVELIVIREHEDSLVLHLRQFSPSLELRTSQDMRLQSLTGQTVRFAGEAGAGIEELAYSRQGEHLRVELSIANGTVVAVELSPNTKSVDQ